MLSLVSYFGLFNPPESTVDMGVLLRNRLNTWGVTPYVPQILHLDPLSSGSYILLHWLHDLTLGSRLPKIQRFKDST